VAGKDATVAADHAAVPASDAEVAQDAALAAMLLSLRMLSWLWMLS